MGLQLRPGALPWPPGKHGRRHNGRAGVNELVDSLFGLAHPWWEMVLRGAAVYVAVLVLVRLVGKRTVGQFTPFDLVLVVVLGESVGHSLVGEDHSLAGGLILAATLLSLNWGLGFLTARWPAFDRVVEGRPVLLARSGELYRDVLRKQSLSEKEFNMAMREQGVSDVAEVELAMLETSGNITIVKKA